MKFSFDCSVIVEASNIEHALQQISGRITDIARHVGSGEKLSDNAPFFAISETTDDDAKPHNFQHDPIVQARNRSAEQRVQDAADKA